MTLAALAFDQSICLMALAVLPSLCASCLEYAAPSNYPQLESMDHHKNLMHGSWRVEDCTRALNLVFVCFGIFGLSLEGRRRSEVPEPQQYVHFWWLWAVVLHTLGVQVCMLQFIFHSFGALVQLLGFLGVSLLAFRRGIAPAFFPRVDHPLHWLDRVRWMTSCCCYTALVVISTSSNGPVYGCSAVQWHTLLPLWFLDSFMYIAIKPKRGVCMYINVYTHTFFSQGH